MPRSKKHKPVRAATLADVGRAAGVSAMAASAVLNNARTSSRISPATRTLILKEAARLAYRPNAAARALANRRMNTLGIAAVIQGGELNHYFLELFNGIIEAAARHEQSTTVFALHDWGRDTARLHGICDGRIDGLILIAPTFAADQVVLPSHTPFVALHANCELANVINIESDEERGAFEMVTHLIERGHRRIMHLTGPAGLIGTERRIRGYKRALAKARITFDPELLVPAHFDPGHGRDAMRGWLRRHTSEPLPQAVFCVNDSVAIGCLEALAEAGLRVPEDVSVAGFDDTLAARTALPQLTTVRQPLRAMGAQAVEILLAAIAPGAAPKAPAKPIVFPTELVVRASVGAPPEIQRLVPRLR
jgi:LacI family transcriptional regulator